MKELFCCEGAEVERSWGGLGIWAECPANTSVIKWFRHVPQQSENIFFHLSCKQLQIPYIRKPLGKVSEQRDVQLLCAASFFSPNGLIITIAYWAESKWAMNNQRHVKPDIFLIYYLASNIRNFIMRLPSPHWLVRRTNYQWGCKTY